MSDLLTQYEAAGPFRAMGREWYDAAHERCAAIAGPHLPVETVARVMAILSPRCFWQTCVTWTEAVVQAYLAGHPVPAVSTGANRSKAWRELHGEAALSGPKIDAFARAILGDHTAVVIDSWTLRTVGLSPVVKVTPKRQRWITAAYTEAAEKVGETPRDMQAILWCAVRGRAT